MTVWRLPWALIGYVLRGRARQPVYVCLDANLPDHVQDQLDRWNLALVETHAPYLRRERFVMVTVKPVGEVPITWPEPDAIDRAVRHRPWPPAAYASGNQDWVNYLHQAYYLLGMLWAVGADEQAILALCEVTKHDTAQRAAPM